MATFGSTINPSLGRTDYSAIQQGANAAAQGILAGGQGIARGIESAGKSIASGIEKYFEEQEKNKIMIGQSKAMIEADPDLAKSIDPAVLESFSKGKVKTKDVVETYSKLKMAVDMRDVAIKKWQFERQKAEVEEQKRIQSSLPSLLQPTSAAKEFLASGGDFKGLGSLGPEAFNERPVGADEFLKRGLQNKIPVNILSPIAERLSDAERIRAASGKPENQTTFEQLFSMGRQAEETRLGRKMTPQELSNLGMSIQRSGSPAGDPELNARLSILTKELPEAGVRADAALRLKPTVTSLMAKMEDGLATGKLEDFKTDVIGFAKALNIPVNAEALGKSESARAQFSQLMFEWLNQTKGSVTERENALFQLMGPEFNKSNAANNDLLKLVKSRMDLDINLGKIYRDGISRGKSLSSINEDLQAERDSFSQKYDAEVESLVESYTNKKKRLDAVRAEIERRKLKGKEGTR